MADASATTRQLRALLLQNIESYDVYTVVLMVIYSTLAILYYPYVDNPSGLIIQNVALLIGIAAVLVVWRLTGYGIAGIVRRFYIIPVIYLMYDQVHALVPAVHPVDYDTLLAAADRALFGGADPTVWLMRWSWPALTEYLQICYFLFYLLPIMQAVELYRTGRIQDFTEFARGMAFCYFVSYLAYFAMPAIGPRFTLHAFASLDADLPGLVLTSTLRDLVNAGGGIAKGSLDPALVVNRDCMPSGHTMLTLVNIILSFRFRSRFRFLFCIVGGSLIISTVYLRYHYVVDVLVGAVLAVVTLPVERWVDGWLRTRRKKCGASCNFS